METLGTLIKKSSKGLSDQGFRFYSETRTASKEFVTFVHEEARGWGDYFRLRYRHLEDHGRELLQQDGQRIPGWTHLDELLSRVTHREARSDIKEVTEEVTDDEGKVGVAAEGEGGEGGEGGNESAEIESKDIQDEDEVKEDE